MKNMRRVTNLMKVGKPLIRGLLIGMLVTTPLLAKESWRAFPTTSANVLFSVDGTIHVPGLVV